MGTHEVSNERGFSGRPLRNTVLVNVSSMAMNVIASIICARMLGPLGRGAFSVIQLWPITAAGLGTLGIPRAVTYYMGKRKYPAATLVATGSLILIAAAVLSMLLLFVCMPYLAGRQPAYVIRYARLCLLLLPLLYLGALPYYVLQGLNYLRTWNIVRVQFSVLWLLMHICGYLLWRRDLAFYVWGYLCVTALHNLTWLFVFLSHFRGLGPLRPAIGRRLFAYGLPLTLGSMPQFLNLRMDQVLMAALVPPGVLGQYVIAVAWSGLITPLLTALSQVLFPAILSLNESSRQYDLLARSFRLSALCATGCAGILAAITPFAIPLVYGRAFAPSVLPACILCVGSVFLSLNAILSEGFRALGLPKFPMYAELLGFVATGGLLVALLPRWPLLGASIASAVSYCFTTLVLVLCAARSGRTSVARLVTPRSGDLNDLQRLAISSMSR